MRSAFRNLYFLTAIAIVTLAVTMIVPTVFAQTSRGTITGTITDPQGAVLPKANVTLIDQRTNVKRETATNGAGLYRFDAVSLSDYTITVEAAGFVKELTKDVSVSAARTVEINFQLKLGAAVDTITVEGTASEVLQTAEQVRGVNIQAQKLIELPITNQNSLTLIRTLPGVVTSNLSGSLDSGVGSVNGSRPRGNNFMIDGVENNDISVAGPVITLTNEDAIQEVAIQTSNFSAEFGRAGGAVINQVTKSGTNRLHGTGAWVYLSPVLNATTRRQRLAFASTGKLPIKKPNKENIPAFTIGGPVVIPHVYDGRNRTFFFAAGQWDRFSSGAAQANFNVPDPAGIATLRALAPTCPNVQRYLTSIGNGSLVAPSDNTQTTPLSIALPSAVGSCNGTNRAGQVIRVGFASRFVPQVNLSDNHQIRVDHRISDKQQITFRWLFDRSTQPNGGTIAINPAFDADFSGLNVSQAINHTYVISNNVTNEFRFNYGRLSVNFPLTNPGNPLASGPTFAFGGQLSAIGTNATFPQGRTANNFQYQDTISWVKGNHQMRFGVDFLRQLARQSAPVNSRGALTYNSNVTNTISAFANFIDDFSGTGTGASRQFGTPVYRPNLFRQAYFFQDSWKVTSTFTANLGLRYENFGQPGNIFPLPVVSLDPTTFGTPSKVKHDNDDFGPSIGFAWNPRSKSGTGSSIWNALTGDGKMVIRGGFQTTYDAQFNNLLSNMAAGGPNNPGNLPLTNPAPAGRGIPGLFANAFPTLAAAPLNPLSPGNSQFAKNMENPRTSRYSLGIQREVAGGVVVDVSYVGAISRNLYVTKELNPVIPNATFTLPSQPTATTSGRLYNNIGSRVIRATAGNSNYNAMQLEVRKAYAHTPIGSIQFNSSYTWSKTMDTISEAFASNSATTSIGSAQQIVLTKRNLDYGVSDLHRKHRWVTSTVWDLPGPSHGVFGEVLGGWSLGAIVPLQSGTPFSISNGRDRNLDNQRVGPRPDIGNIHAPITTRAVITTACPAGLRNPDLGPPPFGTCVTANDVYWVQRGGFSPPTAQTARRNTLFTPGSVTVDLDVIKKFKLTEGISLEYRAEIFNVLNHENFSVIPNDNGPSIDTNDVGSGKFLDYLHNLTGPGTGNRTMRMGLKVIF